MKKMLNKNDFLGEKYFNIKSLRYFKIKFLNTHIFFNS